MPGLYVSLEQSEEKAVAALLGLMHVEVIGLVKLISMPNKSDSNCKASIQSAIAAGQPVLLRQSLVITLRHWTRTRARSGSPVEHDASDETK